MAKYRGKRAASDETRDEAMRIAMGTQREGQSKEQTKLIAQGIEKGITLYKKQRKAKARDGERERKRRDGTPLSATLDAELDVVAPEDAHGQERKLPWLPWTLLVLTWLGVGAYALGVRVPLG